MIKTVKTRILILFKRLNKAFRSRQKPSKHPYTGNLYHSTLPEHGRFLSFIEHPNYFTTANIYITALFRLAHRWHCEGIPKSITDAH